MSGTPPPPLLEENASTTTTPVGPGGPMEAEVVAPHEAPHEAPPAQTDAKEAQDSTAERDSQEGGRSPEEAEPDPPSEEEGDVSAAQQQQQQQQQQRQELLEEAEDRDMLTTPLQVITEREVLNEEAEGGPELTRAEEADRSTGTPSPTTPCSSHHEKKGDTAHAPTSAEPLLEPLPESVMPATSAPMPNSREEEDTGETATAEDDAAAITTLATSSRGNSFPRVMDISELVRMGSSLGRPMTEDEGNEEEEPDHTAAASAAEAIEGPLGGATPAPEEADDVAREPSRTAAPDDDEEVPRGTPQPSATTAALPAVAPEPCPQDISAEPCPAPSPPPPRVRRLTHEESNSAAHTLRLRRTLLSAFPQQVRRYYTLSLLTDDDSGGGGRNGQKEEGSEDVDDEDDDSHLHGSSTAVPTLQQQQQQHGRERVPGEVLEGTTVTELCAAAARAESLLLHSCNSSSSGGREARVRLRAERSQLPEVPKALPLLLDHLCEDKYYVNGAWQRYHEDTQFIKTGASVAVRKRRRASVLGSMVHQPPTATGGDTLTPQPQAAAWRKFGAGTSSRANSIANSSHSHRRGGGRGGSSLEELLVSGDGTTIPTPRTLFTLKDWRADGEEAVRAFQRKLVDAEAKAAAKAAALTTFTPTTTTATAATTAANGQASPTATTTTASATMSAFHSPVSASPTTTNATSTATTTTTTTPTAPTCGGGGGGLTSTAGGVLAPSVSALSAGSRHQSHSTAATKKGSSAPQAPATPTGENEDVGMYDVLTKEEVNMYAKFAMSSGRLRHEVTEPFSTLSVRAAELRREQVLKKL